MRILEITRSGFFKALMPDRTHWIRWGHPLTVDEPHAPEGAGAAALLQLAWRMRGERFDLVVLPAINPGHRYEQPPHKLFAKSALQSAARSRHGATLCGRVLGANRHIIVDVGDDRRLCRTTMRLFPRHALYFKRELALADEGTRVRPLSLFVPNEARMPPPLEKDIDVFFAGDLCNRVRQDAVAAIGSLARRDFRVFAPKHPLPYREFLTTLARAWLVLSPEGHGWDCYRHYEACLAGSVPVINRPSYPRRLYLREGLHCFYYDPNGEGLAPLLARLLADKERLRAMAQSGRRHVLENHTRAAVARYMLSELDHAARPADGAAELPAA